MGFVKYGDDQKIKFIEPDQITEEQKKVAEDSKKKNSKVKESEKK